MDDKKIRAYDGNDAFYSGTDADYEEFLKSVNGKMGGHDAKKDNLEETKTINLQGVIEKFRKKAENIKDASKKLTADAVSKFEEFKKSTADLSEDEELFDDEEKKIRPEDIKVTHAGNVTQEVAADKSDETKSDAAEDIKKVFAEAAKIKNELLSVPGKLDGYGEKIDEINEAVKRLDELLKDIDVISRDSAKNAENACLKSDTIAGGVEEIRQSVVGVSKLNDSIFDLKNSQLNTKNSLENLAESFTSLKKKCILGITILSILSLISIVMSVIILLS